MISPILSFPKDESVLHSIGSLRRQSADDDYHLDVYRMTIPRKSGWLSLKVVRGWSWMETILEMAQLKGRRGRKAGGGAEGSRR